MQQVGIQDQLASAFGGINYIDMHEYPHAAVSTINVPNAGSVPGLPDDLVVETVGRVDRDGFHPLPTPPLPNAVRGLVGAVAEHQRLAADAAWSGRRADGVRALAAHPLVLSLTLAETLYDEMAAAHRDYLPERLLR